MAIPQRLLDAYLRTNFEAETPTGTLSVRCGRRHELLDALLARHAATTWAFISGCNPRSRPLSDAENARRHGALRARLGGAFPVYEGRGVAADWAEPSLLVIGIGPSQAAQAGRDFGQNAIVVGERGGVAALRDCWTLWPDDPQVEPAGLVKAVLDDDCYCRCPLCGAAYREATERCCEHLVTDWCFTFHPEPGCSRGYWASDGEGRVLIGFESELRRLSEALGDHEWPRQARREFVGGIPAHLAFVCRGGGPIGYDGLLCERLAASAGYARRDPVVTDNPMVSDSWDVHWARDAAAVARAVDQRFASDLAWLTDATILAARLLRLDPRELGMRHDGTEAGQRSTKSGTRRTEAE